MQENDPTRNPNFNDNEMSPGQNLPENLLEQRNQLLDAQVKEALDKKVESITSVELPKPTDYSAVALRDAISETITQQGYSDRALSIGPPTRRNAETQNTDLAFNVAPVAKQMELSPPKVAQELATEIEKNELISQVANTGPFVNIEVDYNTFAPRVFDEVETYKDKFGYSREGQPSVVIVDYSSPNVAKNMTAAHIRSTVIGHSLTKIQEAVGNVPFGVNHLGDWGSQFGNIIYEYRKELRENKDDFEQRLAKDPTTTLMEIYRTFEERKDNDPEAVAEAQKIFLELEQCDPELLELWDKFRQWSLIGFDPTYARLGIEFDATQGESFYEDRMTSAVDDAVEQGVLKVNEEGSVIFPSQVLVDPTSGKTNEQVMLDKEGGPRDELIMKPSGGTVYLTRDLAGIRYRGKELNVDKILYVIGKEQKAHCLELFAMSDQLGYMSLGSAEHISFGHLNVNGRKMKSRSGKVALLNEILDESIEAATNLIQDRKASRGDTSEITESELETARMIGTSAIIFDDLKQNREKDIDFNPNTAETVEAGSSTYIQYTHARLASILDKAGEPDTQLPIPEELSTNERRIIQETARFPLVIKDAAKRNAPHKIASYLTEYCQAVNLFYQESSIAKAPTETDRNFRLNIVKVAEQVVKNASYLLHLELPEEM